MVLKAKPAWKERKKCKMKRKFMIYGFNMAKSFHCADFLKNLTAGTKAPFIACLQEPYRSSNLGLDQRLQIFRGTGKQPRAGIYASDGLNLSQVVNLCDNDTCTVLWTSRGPGNQPWNKHETVILAGYWDIKKSNPPLWAKAAEYARQRGAELLLQVDANAHSELFGATVVLPRDGQRRDKLEEFLEDHSLVPINKGSVPTWEARGTSSITDLFIASETLARNLTHYRVHNNLTNYSDHHLISVQMTAPKPEYKLQRQLEGVDWDGFKDYVHTHLGETTDPSTTGELDMMTEQLHSVITEALDIYAPLKQKRVKRNPCTFWNAELQGRQVELNRLYKEFQKSRSPDVEEEHKLLKREQKKRIAHYKKWAWRRLGFETDNPTAMAKLRKILSSGNHASVCTLKKSDGSYTQDVEESINLLVEKNFPDSAMGWSESKQSEKFAMNKPDWLSMERIVAAIYRLKPHKASGPDEIKPIVLQNLPRNALERLRLIYCGSTCSGYVPELWKRSKIVFIPKPGKKTYDEVKSFRPITLSNHPLKVLERLVLWQMEETALAANPLSGNQHAYRSDRTSETAAHQVQAFAEKGVAEGNYVVSVNIDITSAFNGILVDTLTDSMRRRGVDESIVKWYEDLVKSRKAEITIKGSTIRVEIKRGVPQGGVIAVLIWNLAADDLLHSLDNARLQLLSVAFADDVSMNGKGRVLSQVLKRMQKGLNIAKQWAESKGLTISADKTTWIVYTKKRNKGRNLKLKLGDQEVERVKKVKYLGFVFDEDLKWDEHIQEKISSARKALYTFKKAFPSNWGPHQRAQAWLWTCAVRPIILYGSLIWGHRARHWREKLRSLQRLALCQQGLVRKNTPGRALEVTTGTIPLHIKIEETRLLSATRLLSCINRKCASGERIIADLSGQGLPTSSRLYDKIPSIAIREQPCEILVGDGKPLADREDGLAVAYTDGSGLNGQFGAACTLEDEFGERYKSQARLPDHATVFMAEMKAIRLAIELFQEKRSEEWKLIIMVDSQAALKALKAKTLRSRITKETIESIQRAKEDGTEIILSWVRAHAGHGGNEEADKLAREASLGVIKQAGIPKSHVKSVIRFNMIKKWQKEWDDVQYSQQKHRQSRFVWPKIDLARSRALTFTSKMVYSQVLRWCSGFTGLRHTNWRQGQDSDNICRLCEQDQEDVVHVLARCPKLGWLRRQTFGEFFYDEEHTFVWTSKNMLGFLRSPVIRAMENCDDEGLIIIFYEEFEKYKNIIEMIEEVEAEEPQEIMDSD